MSHSVVVLDRAVRTYIDKYGKDHEFNFSNWPTEQRYVVSVSYGLVELMEIFEERECAFCRLSTLNVPDNRAALVALYIGDLETGLWPLSRVDGQMKKEGDWVKSQLELP